MAGNDKGERPSCVTFYSDFDVPAQAVHDDSVYIRSMNLELKGVREAHWLKLGDDAVYPVESFGARWERVACGMGDYETSLSGQRLDLLETPMWLRLHYASVGWTHSNGKIWSTALD